MQDHMHNPSAGTETTTVLSDSDGIGDSMNSIVAKAERRTMPLVGRWLLL